MYSLTTLEQAGTPVLVSSWGIGWHGSSALFEAPSLFSVENPCPVSLFGHGDPKRMDAPAMECET